MHRVNHQAFGFSPNDVEEALRRFNENCADKGEPISRQNVLSCVSNRAFTDGSTCQQLCQAAQEIVATDDQLDSIVMSIQNNATNMNHSLNEFQRQLRRYISAISLIFWVANKIPTEMNFTFLFLHESRMMWQVNSVVRESRPVLESVKAFHNNTNCGFIGQAYRDIKSSICVLMLDSLTMLSLCTLLIGALNVHLAALTVILLRRLPRLRLVDADRGPQEAAQGRIEPVQDRQQFPQEPPFLTITSSSKASQNKVVAT